MNKQQEQQNKWLKKYHDLNPENLNLAKSFFRNLIHKPKISIILTISNPQLLDRTIESVVKQLYSNWELIIIGSSSINSTIHKNIEQWETRDCRIKTFIQKKDEGISNSLNSGLNLCTGDFIGILGQDDLLAPAALGMMAHEINLCLNAKIIYSDEDKISTEGNRYEPHFKSSWNPILFLSQNYINNFVIISKDLVDNVGGFRNEYDSIEDWDLLLRATSLISNEQEIRRIPLILYHTRTKNLSSNERIDIILKTQKCLTEHFTREGIKAKVYPTRDYPKIQFEMDNYPEVTIVIPTRDKSDILKKCVDSVIEKTTYPNFKIQIIDNGSKEKKTLEYLNQISGDKITVIRDEGEFNYSRIHNDAIEKIDSPLICLLNNDMEIITPEWLTEMVSYTQFEKVGIVGAKLIYPNDTIQHAGVIIGIGGVAGHSHKKMPISSPRDYYGRSRLPQNLTAVTAACMLIKKSIYERVGGLEEQLAIAFNDVDLCLKVRSLGYHVIYNAYAQLYHHESLSRGKEETEEQLERYYGEINYIKDRWKTDQLSDPYYSPNLSTDHDEFIFKGKVPNIQWPWRNK